MLPPALMNVTSGEPEISRSNLSLLSAMPGESGISSRESLLPATLSSHHPSTRPLVVVGYAGRLSPASLPTEAGFGLSITLPPCELPDSGYPMNLAHQAIHERVTPAGITGDQLAVTLRQPLALRPRALDSPSGGL